LQCFEGLKKECLGAADFKLRSLQEERKEVGKKAERWAVGFTSRDSQRVLEIDDYGKKSSTSIQKMKIISKHFYLPKN